MNPYLSSQEPASRTLRPQSVHKHMQSTPEHLSSQEPASSTTGTKSSTQVPDSGHYPSSLSAVSLWDISPQPELSRRATILSSQMTQRVKPNKPQSKLIRADEMSPQIDPVLPFGCSKDIGDFPAPAKAVLKPGHLKDMYFSLPTGRTFTDKVLPRPGVTLTEHKTFPVGYYIQMYKQSSAPGTRGQYRWPCNTPNYIGARIPLVHTAFNINRWRYHLTGYHSPEIIQFLEYGFPLGLNQLPTLSPALANHGSAYQFYPWLDKFFSTGLLKGGVTGPCLTVPFPEAMISPLMTAPKKPDKRRAVFDATFGQHSLNNATPCEYYMGVKTVYTYPKIEDFKDIIIKCGKGCYLWKRDLARYYLQLPLDPTEYRYTGAIWRGTYFFFTSLMFGLRHSGLQGQKVTDAISWVQRNLGLEYIPPQPLLTSTVDELLLETRNRAIVPIPDTDRQAPYNCVNYCDDLAGCEKTKDKAVASFHSLGKLFVDLGLAESKDKASAPSTSMVYLGVQFDTIKMTMSVPPEKLQEVRADLEIWRKKTTAVRKNLQSLLGKLFWISKVVKHSRPFLGRLLQQLRDMKGLPENRKIRLTEDSIKDILWWLTYLRTFNGVSAIINDHDTCQTLEHLMPSPFKVCAGDATLWGGGAWYGQQYWSCEFPDFLKQSEIAIHIKEFWTVICSCWVWGDEWANDVVYIFCDNDAVVDTIAFQKPKDPDMNTLLREFLYVVCLKKFSPILRKIDTKENLLADHISRRYDHESADKLFTSIGKPGMVKIKVQDHRFKLSAPW